MNWYNEIEQKTYNDELSQALAAGITDLCVWLLINYEDCIANREPTWAAYFFNAYKSVLTLI